MQSSLINASSAERCWHRRSPGWRTRSPTTPAGRGSWPRAGIDRDQGEEPSSSALSGNAGRVEAGITVSQALAAAARRPMAPRFHRPEPRSPEASSSDPHPSCQAGMVGRRATGSPRARCFGGILPGPTAAD